MRSRFLLSVAFLIVITIAGAMAADPRPLSEAERAGVSLVSEFLARGPEAFYDALSANAPLRTLTRDQALAEISVRVGPQKDVQWALQTAIAPAAQRVAVFSVLFPSGIDEVVTLEMRKAGAKWQLVNVRTSAEPYGAVGFQSRAQRPTTPMASFEFSVAPMLVLPACVLALLAVAVYPDSRLRGGLALGISVALVLVACGGVLVVQRRAPVVVDVKPVPRPAGFFMLASLQPLRNAMVMGGAVPSPSPGVGDPSVHAVDVVWRARMYLEDKRYAGVRATLRGVPGVELSPMAGTVLARAFFQEGNSESAVVAYERAQRTGIGHDVPWVEGAVVLAGLGYDERAFAAFQDALKMGTRDPSVYYALSMLLAMDGKEDESAAMFLRAWRMRPLERSDALSLRMLWRVFRTREVDAVLRLHSAIEETASTPCAGGIEVPEPLPAEVSGDYLLVRSDSSELHVPGGAGWAPKTCRVIDAGVLRRREEEAALAQREVTQARLGSAAAFAEARFRTRALLTAKTMADRNRWNDLITFTSALNAADERVPMELLIHRGTALSRTGDLDGLRRLVVSLLKNPIIRRSQDANALVAVADLVAILNLHDGAIGLLAKAQKEAELPAIPFRIQRLAIERELTKTGGVHRTKHFDLRYPATADRAGVFRAGEVLEAELLRMQKDWLPLPQFRRTVVNILWYEQFAAYAGSPFVLGLFTDEIFLPIAGVTEFSPEIVALMSHELMHAMLTQRTNDGAPRWFQEAFATHVEMVDESPNAFVRFERDHLLSVSVLDAAVETPDPELVGEGYAIAATVLRYLEARGGRGVHGRLIDAFSRGATTEDALREVTGLSLADLDAQARAWAFAQPADFPGQIAVRYDEYPVIRRGSTAPRDRQ